MKTMIDRVRIGATIATKHRACSIRYSCNRCNCWANSILAIISDLGRFSRQLLQQCPCKVTQSKDIKMLYTVELIKPFTRNAAVTEKSPNGSCLS